MVGFGLRDGLVRRTAALGCVVALLSGCGQSAQPTGDPTDADGEERDLDPAQGESPGDGPTAEGSTEPLAWVPFGPADPTNPTPSWPVYRHLAQGECSALEAYLADEGSGVGDFGTALVAVCRAAVEGQQDQWDVAAGLRDADASTLGNDCLAAVLKTLLDRAVEWHERNPGQRPEVAFSSVSGTTDCAADSQDASDSDDAEGTDGSGTDPSGAAGSGGEEPGGGESGTDGSGDGSGDVSGGDAPETTG